jgi:hypothetical protein
LIPSRYHWDQLDAKLIVLDINFPVRKLRPVKSLQIAAGLRPVKKNYMSAGLRPVIKLVLFLEGCRTWLPDKAEQILPKNKNNKANGRPALHEVTTQIKMINFCIGDKLQILPRTALSIVDGLRNTSSHPNDWVGRHIVFFLASF